MKDEPAVEEPIEEVKAVPVVPVPTVEPPNIQNPPQPQIKETPPMQTRMPARAGKYPENSSGMLPATTQVPPYPSRAFPPAFDPYYSAYCMGANNPFSSMMYSTPCLNKAATEQYIPPTAAPAQGAYRRTAEGPRQSKPFANGSRHVAIAYHIQTAKNREASKVPPINHP